MRNWRMVGVFAALLLVFLFATHFTVGAFREVKTLVADDHQQKMVQFNNLQLIVPAGATKGKISVGWGDQNLRGIKLPYGFKALSRPYRFGPHGLKF